MIIDPCDDVRERLFLGRTVRDDERHLAACPECRREAETLTTLARAFAADHSAAPSPALAPRVLAAARPLLAAKHRHAARRAVAAAVAAALVPLPLILVLDLLALRAIYAGLTHLLPSALSLYLVVNYAGVLALLGALTYGAIPLLAERQARLREVPHG